MFSDNAEFDNLVEGVGLKVSEVFQKAVIDVNENGTEAAAATSKDFIEFLVILTF